MSRVYLVDSHPEESAALRLMLMDLGQTVVGESTDWANSLSCAAGTSPDVLLVDVGLLPGEPAESLQALSEVCSQAWVIALVDRLDSIRQAGLCKVANAIISREAAPEQVAECLRATPGLRE